MHLILKYELNGENRKWGETRFDRTMTVEETAYITSKI